MRGSKSLLIGIILLALPVFGYALDDQIAYLRLTDHYWQVWVTDQGGNDHHQLTYDPIDKTRISWAADRTAILCNRSDGILSLIDIDKTTPVQLALPVTGMLDAQVSPDNQWIAYSISATQNLDNNDLWLINTKSKTTKRLTNKPGVVLSPAWDAQGSAILYSSGTVEEGNEIWQVDITSGSSIQRTVGLGRKVDPSFSTQGDIAYASDTAGNYDIWVLDNQTQKPKQLTQNAAYDVMPSWSPDGKHIAFSSQRGGHRRIWVMDREGQSIQPITPEAVASRSPAWVR